MEIVIAIIIIIVLYYVVKVYLNSAQHKGARGENRVARQLEKLNKDEYAVFNDVIINTSKGTSQIDHVVISIYGIFVLETKNYSGWIHGHEKAQYWTQTFYKKKTRLWNPIKQNWGHIYALKEVLSRRVKYHPIIVFAGSAELRNVHTEIPVIYGSQLLHVIRQYDSPALTRAEVQQLSEKLLLALNHEKNAKRKHVQNVHTKEREWKKAVKNLECPRCGNQLVLRSGPYGKFYGCTNYPRCRYKLNY